MFFKKKDSKKVESKDIKKKKKKGIDTGPSKNFMEKFGKK